MKRQRRTAADPLERDIEAALRPGCFIDYGECSSFVSGLDEVVARIVQLTSTDPRRTVALLETFIAGAYEKAEEVDDSDGDFGRFAGGLCCTWVTGRQAAASEPADTAARLLEWMDDDPYGFCNQLEREAAGVLNPAGLAAFARLIRARFDAAIAVGPGAGRASFYRRHWAEALRAIYLVQNDLTAYVALAEETAVTAEDCHAVATLLVARRKPSEALSWVERGVDLDAATPYGSAAGHDLAKLKRRLLTELGRGDEALAAAWADYCRHPGMFTYEELLSYVPGAERSSWHEKAMEAASGTDLASLMALLLKTKELDRLTALVRDTEDAKLRALSHFTTEPVAEQLELTHPELAARLWCAQGLRIVNAKKSTYYAAALVNLERAKHCYERAGLVGEWEKVVEHVRADHRRKFGFMPGFERLVAGIGPSDEPTFLERAKARWGTGRNEAR